MVLPVRFNVLFCLPVRQAPHPPPPWLGFKRIHQLDDSVRRLAMCSRILSPAIFQLNGTGREIGPIHAAHGVPAVSARAGGVERSA